MKLERLFSQVAKLQQSTIARRARLDFRQRGCSHGLDLQDWLGAEREIRGSR